MTYKEILKDLIQQAIRMRKTQNDLDKYPRCKAIEEEQKFDKMVSSIKKMKL